MNFRSEHLKYTLTQEELAHQVATYAQEHLAMKQLSNRLQDFIEPRLKASRRKHKISGQSYARASRFALLDPEYLEAVVELVDFQSKARENKILWRTHRMLYFARKTKRIKS